MEIVKVDPGDASAVAAWHAAWQAGLDADREFPATWTAPEVAVWLRGGDPGRRWEAYAAVDAGRVLGAALVALPLLDNLKLVMFDLAVPPEQRRRGVGSALYQRVVELARAEGRHSLLVEVPEPYQGKGPDAGVSFAGHRGFTCRSRELHRVLRLPLERAVLDGLALDAAEHHRDYQLRSWTGPCPEDLLREYVTLRALMVTEAPLGDLEYEPEHWDPARLRADEARRAAQRRTAWITVAVSRSGALAGHTVIDVPGHDPGVLYQNDTLVLPEHRGHRLGLALKVANLRAVQAAHPDRGLVHTWNAEDNHPMAAVNDAMGFRPVGRIGEWQRDL
jgi:GNAT superfamily N-acetyltransferase